MPQSPLDARFWKKVNKDGPIPSHCPELGPCWIWTASLDKSGYGQIGTWTIRKSPMRAHRVAWFLTHGYFPKEGVLHKCDNPPCVNPTHLFAGDQKANVRDAIAKGRDIICYGGERNPQSKLLENQVIEILRIGRENNQTQTAIAKQFGVSRRTVGFILSGERWPHVFKKAAPPATGRAAI
jgi:hypothetical protein